MMKFRKSTKNKSHETKYLKNVLQLGNFLIKKKGNGEFSFIRVSTVDGTFAMDFREDTMKYAWLIMLASDDRYHEILRAWLTVAFHVVMCNPDPQFLDNTIKELYALNDRASAIEQERKNNPSDNIAKQG